MQFSAQNWEIARPTSTMFKFLSFIHKQLCIMRYCFKIVYICMFINATLCIYNLWLGSELLRFLFCNYLFLKIHCPHGSSTVPVSLFTMISTVVNKYLFNCLVIIDTNNNMYYIFVIISIGDWGWKWPLQKKVCLPTLAYCILIYMIKMLLQYQCFQNKMFAFLLSAQFGWNSFEWVGRFNLRMVLAGVFSAPCLFMFHK